MALDLIKKAAGNVDFQKVIEGAKVGANTTKLSSVLLYPSEYQGDWSYICELVFNIGGTDYSKKLYISKKGAESESELGLDQDAVGRVNNLLQKAFSLDNPYLIEILNASPVQQVEIERYRTKFDVNEYKPQMLLNVEVVVVMKKNDAGYFDIAWIFNPNDKEGIDEAVKKAKEVASTAVAKPTSIGGGANRPSIGGGKRPSIKVGW